MVTHGSLMLAMEATVVTFAIDGKATAVCSTSKSKPSCNWYLYLLPNLALSRLNQVFASPELAYYDKGMSVRYDKVLTADGHTWLSYTTYSGARRYVDIFLRVCNITLFLRVVFFLVFKS